MAPMVSRWAATVVALALSLFGGGGASAQVGLPAGDLFQPLMASPRQPRFSASYLWASSPLRDTRVGATAFGADIGIVRWGGAADGPGVQIGLAGGVFAQFDMESPSTDLMNADYIIGIPVSFRTHRFTGRVQFYHQSSHLGDEYLIRYQPDRINLSFEAIELLFSGNFGPLRVYGGGEYLVHREPDTLRPGVLIAGLEYRAVHPVLRAGDVGAARFVLAVDARFWEQHAWVPGVSGKAGLEFSPHGASEDSGRHWSILVEGYSGPSPYGQFYDEDIASLGLGLYFWL